MKGCKIPLRKPGTDIFSMRYIIIFWFFFLTLSSQVAFAQEASSTVGGDFSGSDGSVAYTVGQVACIALSGPSGSELQGVQQPYEVFGPTAIDEDDETISGVEVYPNPASHELYISIPEAALLGQSYDLADMTGHVLISGRVESALTPLDLSGVAQATYLLRISSLSGVGRTFKIVKH